MIGEYEYQCYRKKLQGYYTAFRIICIVYFSLLGLSLLSMAISYIRGTYLLLTIPFILSWILFLIVLFSTIPFIIAFIVIRIEMKKLRNEIIVYEVRNGLR